MVKCEFENCGKHAYFNTPGESRGRFCKQHSSSGHVDVINKRCAAENCNAQPVFNNPDQPQGKYCKAHAPEGCIDVKHKRCAVENCGVRPHFNKPDQTRGKYCKAHAPEGYVDVKNKRCAAENCNARPYFNKPDQTRGKYCKAHAPEGCIDVLSKRCAAENCNAYPCFNKPDQTQGKYCKVHAPEGCIDVKNKQCATENCITRPIYGKPGYAPEYCVSHRTSDMVANPLKVKAEKKACGYCSHEIHYTEQFCSGCKQYQRLGKTVKLHEKELTVKSWLEEKKLNFIHDRIIDNKCSRKRPDFFIQTVWGAIILEVDEHQHISKTYGCACELIRMRQIYMDAGMSKVLFIRYNPDKYESESRNLTQLQRKEYVLKFLMRMINDDPKDNLSVCYLFYDHFVLSAPEIEKIDAY